MLSFIFVILYSLVLEHYCLIPLPPIRLSLKYAIGVAPRCLCERSRGRSSTYIGMNPVMKRRRRGRRQIENHDDKKHNVK